ncbi:MAG TPA: DUF4395 domain-containing protein [Aggregatilineales bacterium]|nr:DUF4395 domain-containing protein [Aggregatilineales bacterium]
MRERVQIQMVRKVDHNALRTNQAFIIVLLGLAYVLDLTPLVAFVAVVMLVGSIYPPVRLFVLFYQHILKPAGLLKPDVVEDNPEPHRFSMALGGIFTTASTIAFLLEASTIGWILSFIVVGLAALNLFLGFCAGCFVYYQLNRLGIPGFERAPIQQGQATS